MKQVMKKDKYYLHPNGKKYKWTYVVRTADSRNAQVICPHCKAKAQWAMLSRTRKRKSIWNCTGGLIILTIWKWEEMWLCDACGKTELKRKD
jgi:predicted RNA-binding Zn-ribbon protein involved in translation (DUF1610 family)